MPAVASQIMQRVRGKGRGWVFTPKNFVDFGTRGSIDMALSRLTRAGSIRRIGRGLYDFPRQHGSLGALSPDPAAIAQAVSAQSGDKIASSGAVANNCFGLSTQVPARATFATSGRSRVHKAGGRSVTLRHSRAPILDNVSDTANAVVQALAHLGRDKIDRETILQFASRVNDKDISDLVRARSQMTGWMGDVVLRIHGARRG